MLVRTVFVIRVFLGCMRPVSGAREAGPRRCTGALSDPWTSRAHAEMCSRTPMRGSRVAAKSCRTCTLLKAGHCSLRSSMMRMYCFLSTLAQVVETPSEDDVQGVDHGVLGGGISMDGTSAVDCAKKIVLPVSAFSWTAGSLCRPRRTCFQQHLPRDASILVARDASRTCRRSLPIQLSLAQALVGRFGLLVAMSTRQSQQVPILAQRGCWSAG